jgi:hypothetical protein
VGVCLTLCLFSGVLAAAWIKSPLLHGSADFIYACAGVNVRGRFRIGLGWASNLAGLTPLYVSLPQTVCGYLPRPHFLAEYGTRIYQP